MKACALCWKNDRLAVPSASADGILWFCRWCGTFVKAAELPPTYRERLEAGDCEE